MAGLFDLAEPHNDGEPYTMRAPCAKCGATEGVLSERGSQDVVRCANCGVHCYNAPRTETGKAVRSVQTVHSAIKPKQRSRILERATGKCEICGKLPESAALHVGHLLSAKQGLASGMTEADLNDDENLAALCDECNLGIGKQTLPLRMVIAILFARLRNKSNDELRG